MPASSWRRPLESAGRPRGSDPCSTRRSARLTAGLCPALRGSSHPMLPLHELKPGQRASIESVQADDAIGQRLLEMGLLEGEQIQVIGFAPLGDPMEILLRDYRLSLRRTEAARVRVKLVSTER